MLAPFADDPIAVDDAELDVGIVDIDGKQLELPFKREYIAIRKSEIEAFVLLGRKLKAESVTKSVSIMKITD